MLSKVLVKHQTHQVGGFYIIILICDYGFLLNAKRVSKRCTIIVFFHSYLISIGKI
jgi:hypothetical protein